MVSEEKPGQIESAVLGVAAILPFQAFKTWITAYFRPSAAIKAGPASLGAAAKNLATAGFLVGLVSGIVAFLLIALFSGLYSAGTMMGFSGISAGGSPSLAGGIVTLVTIAVLTPILYVIGGFIGSAVFFVLAKILGGKGSYTMQTHAFALVMCGAALLSLPFQILGVIPLIGMVFELAMMLIMLYALYSYYRAIKAVHQLSQMRAIAVIVLPIIVLVVLMVVLLGAAFLAILGTVGSAAGTVR